MGRSRFRPSWVFIVVCGALGTACSDVPTTPESRSDVELPPITLDWVGYYAGSATGTIDGVVTASWPVDMFITFDASPSPTCPACVTVRLVEWFHRTHLFPQNPIAATWSYEVDGVTRTLNLQKFSGGSGPGGTLLGSITVESTKADGTPRVDVMVTLALERVS